MGFSMGERAVPNAGISNTPVNSKVSINTNVYVVKFNFDYIELQWYK